MRDRRWQLVPAWFGSGTWLLALDDHEHQAFAPPGVALTGAADERVGRWSRGSWERELDHGHPQPPARTQGLTVEEVLASVPADYRQWVIAATERQLEVLDLYIDACRAGETNALAARATRLRLADELRRSETPTPASSSGRAASAGHGLTPARAAGFAAACRALSDCDFTAVVTRLLREEMDLKLRPLRSALGADVLTAEADRYRFVVQVKHDPRPGVRRDCWVDYPAPPEDGRETVHWLVTSNASGEAERVARPDAVRVLGAAQLTTILARRPQFFEDAFKFKLACASASEEAQAAPLYSSPARLPAIAETAPLAEARTRLRAAGALVIQAGPGMGKTTLAQLLLAEAAVDGFTIADGRMATELMARKRRPERLALLFEDVRGVEQLGGWLGRAADSDDVRVIVTTRERVEDRKLAAWCLAIKDYAQRDRARIIYNHLWPKLVEDPWKAARGWSAACRALVEHPRFSPLMAARFAGSPHLEPGLGESPAKNSGRSEPECDRFFERLGQGWHACACCDDN